METFTFTFTGKHARELTERFSAYSWDGGLNQTVEQGFLEDVGPSLDDVEEDPRGGILVKTDGAVIEGE